VKRVAAIDTGTSSKSGTSCEPWIFPADDRKDYYTKFAGHCSPSHFRESELLAAGIGNLLSAAVPPAAAVWVPAILATGVQFTSGARIDEQWAVGTEALPVLPVIRGASFRNFVARSSPEDRGDVVNDFISALRRMRNFDVNRVKRDQGFRGRARHHWLDIVVSGNGEGPSFAHVLPFRSREVKHLFLHRGAILDAAEDSHPESVKLALYQDPPADRTDLLKETSTLLIDRGVQLFRSLDIENAAELFETRLIDRH
jgi:hypothetical protein